MLLPSFVLIALALPAICVAAAEGDNHRTTNVVNLVKHPDVTVTGEIITERSLGRQISRFLGIPYAQPPVGERRFHRPLPWVPSSASSVDATAWRSQCTQMNFPHELSSEPFLAEHSPNTTEDCLYMNIWSPELKESAEQRSASLRPVVVWIHGGGLYFGSSSFELYNLETFASRADVVAVSFNYRLATLGFFYSDAVPEVSGNQGLWDQAAALQFVQDNIAAFGGDPKQVTIIGESAGSWSVSAHIVSPVSRNLFSQAILMSGAVHHVQEPESYVKAVLPAIRTIGCASEETQSISKDVVECLQKLDKFVVDKLLFGVFGMRTGVLVKDRHFFPDTPRNLLTSGNHKKSFNLLLSTAEDEAPFVFFNFPNDTRFLDNPTSITLEESKAVLVSLFKGKEGFNEEIATKVYYSGQNGAIVNSHAYRQKVSIAYGDYIIGCPTFNFAKKLYASDQTSSVYQWYYTAKEGNYQKWMCRSWEKACHTDDLFPTFGVPFRFPERFTNRERDVSNEVIDFLKHFVHTGKPGLNQKEWEPYFMTPAGSKNGGQEKMVVAPYYEISNSIRSPESFKFNLKQLECETVWGQMPGL